MAKAETLQDLFNQTTLNASLWSQFTSGATLAYSSSGATVTLPNPTTSSTDGDISANTTYDLTNSYVFLQGITMPAPTAGSTDAQLWIRIDSNNWLRWVYEAGTLYAQYMIAGASTTVFSVAYNATTHKYWRIREGTGAGAGGTAGNTYWDTSTDGLSWTNRGSVATPITVTALSIFIACISFGADTAAGTFKWNNFNILPSTTPTNLFFF